MLIAGSIAVATSLGLQVAGNLRGPSLLPAGGALLESLVMAGFGVAAGLVIVARTARSDPSASPSS